MTSLRDVIAHEESVLAGSARLRSIHADAVRRGRASVAAVMDESGDSDDAETRLHRLYAQTLEEYAARVDREVPEADARTWRDLVSALPGDAWHDLLRTHGAAGAARLLEAMDLARNRTVPPTALDAALTAAARTCVCGYAKTGTLPKRLCQACAGAVGAAWVAEEQRLLQRAMTLQAEVGRILDEATSAIADARSRGEDAYGTEQVALARTRRKLARANRRHREERSRLDVSRWKELAGLARRASMPAMSAEARRARHRLGMAQLARLALHTNHDVQARMSSRARERGTS